MNDETRKNLVDILQAAEEIQSFMEGMDFRAYLASPVTRRAVERDFEIIGEAPNRTARLDEQVLKSISEYHRIIGFRNILIHAYDTVDENCCRLMAQEECVLSPIGTAEPSAFEKY